MTFADTLSDAVRKRARINAIFSALFGCIVEQAIDTNTLLILYIGMLSGSESFSMFATSISGLSCIVLLIPSAGLVNRFGLRPSYQWAIRLQVLMILLMALAPYAGTAAGAVVIWAYFGFTLLRSFYTATWLPLLDHFLRAEERSRFFGTLRFSYMLFNMLLIFGVGRLMGQDAPIWILQLYWGVAGLALLGRKFFIDRFPLAKQEQPESYKVLPALQTSLRNSPLVGFSFYFGFLNLAVQGAFPLAVIYMKKALQLGDSTVMTITAIGICGQIAGYALNGPLTRRIGLRWMEIGTHLLFLAVIGLLLVTAADRAWSAWFLGVLFFFNGVASAFLLCFGSTEMLALGRPGNKVMAMAFSCTFQYMGTALGRLGSTVLLALGVLVPVWEFGGRSYTLYHTLFFFDFVLTLLGLLFLLLTPALIPHHEDYYRP